MARSCTRGAGCWCRTRDTHAIKVAMLRVISFGIPLEDRARFAKSARAAFTERTIVR